MIEIHSELAGTLTTVPGRGEMKEMAAAADSVPPPSETSLVT